MITLTAADVNAANNLGDFIADCARKIAAKNGVADAARYVDAVTDYLFGDFADANPALFAGLLAKMS